MAQDLGQLTDMWMVNPTMFDPTQKSNRFGLYNNAALPYPPTYNGVPTNAMGQPIQSFVDWQKANPGGVSINSTPAQPAAPQGATYGLQPSDLAGPSALNPSGNLAVGMADWGGMMSPQARDLYRNSQFQNPGGGYTNPSLVTTAGGAGQAGAATAGAQQPQASAPPNNWQAAINALANPGNPVTQGATVPMQSGTQPAGGINQAFLQQAGAGQGMNQNFLSALRAIQGR